MTMDIANLSETMRQGEATRAALGVQLRTRPLWSGAGRFTGVPVRFINPYRMRPVNSPEYLFENIVHNGAVYMADGQTSTGNATVYTGTDLKAWVARNAGSSEALVAGKMLAAGSLLFTVTSYAGNSLMKNSVDNGVTWVYQGGGANGMSFSSAGGYIYGLSGTGTTAFQTMSAAAPAPANRNFATARVWNKVVHNGTRWLALATHTRQLNGAPTGWTAGPALRATLRPWMPCPAARALRSRWAAGSSCSRRRVAQSLPRTPTTPPPGAWAPWAKWNPPACASMCWALPLQKWAGCFTSR